MSRGCSALTVASHPERARGWRPGGSHRRADAFLLGATRRRAAAARETFIVVAPVEVEAVVLEQHHVLLGEIELGGHGRFGLELGHGKVEGLVRLVGQQHVSGRLMKQHGHIVLRPAPERLGEVDGVVVKAALAGLGGVRALEGGRRIGLYPPPDSVAFEIRQILELHQRKSWNTRSAAGHVTALCRYDM